jgi:hypothetical protein
MYNQPSFLEKAVGLSFLAAILVIIVALITGATALLLGLIFYFTWNHGAVSFLNGTLGASVAGVSYWTAFFVTWFIGLVGTLVKGSQTTATSS